MGEASWAMSEVCRGPPRVGETLHSAEGAVLALRQHSTLPVGGSHREAKSASAQWRGLECETEGPAWPKGTEAGAVGGKGAGGADPQRNTVGAGGGKVQGLTRCKSRQQPWAEPQRGLQQDWPLGKLLPSWALAWAAVAGGEEGGSQAVLGLRRAGAVRANAHARMCTGSGLHAQVTCGRGVWRLHPGGFRGPLGDCRLCYLFPPPTICD